jgi:hypothetical protein
MKRSIDLDQESDGHVLRSFVPQDDKGLQDDKGIRMTRGRKKGWTCVEILRSSV